MKRKKSIGLLACAVGLTAGAIILSLAIGKFPLDLEEIFRIGTMSNKVFVNLRLPRTVVAVVGGFALGIAGSVFQTVFRNPLAAPDMIGVSSGASAGAAFAILFLPGSFLLVTLSSFVGGISAVVMTLLLSAFAKRGGNASIVLAGIAVQSVASTFLTVLKITADPEKELSAIEYWIMGGLGGVSLSNSIYSLLVCILSLIPVFMLYRQILILSLGDDEAKLLGVSSKIMRFAVLLFATLAVSATVSLTGVIGFVGLLAPHAAKLIMKKNSYASFWLGGVLGSFVLTIADIISRSIAATELPVSIFTSVIGAPFLIYLMVWGGREYE